jgi:hypothetical protein
VNATFPIFLAIAAVLLLLLVLALRKPRKRSTYVLDPVSLEQAGRRHATYLALIRQALAPADLDFLSARAPAGIAFRVAKERRKVALHYLACLRDDFRRLLRLAQAVAVLSSEVGTAEEFERFRLSLQFSFRYQMMRIGLYFGLLPLSQLNSLSLMVSELAVRMDNAMRELGERAALAAKIASSLNGGGVDVA